MKRIHPFDKPVVLSGFNNLTKSLSFNLYDFCIARNDYERNAYRDYVHERFNAEKVTQILKHICGIIEAEILAVSDQSYEPWGASSMVLMGDLKGAEKTTPIPGVHPLTTHPNGTAAHLDKSHICAHTYPDFRAEGTVCSIRLDIEISTCGEISPLRALNYLLGTLDNDFVVIDYKVRGFTRDDSGRRVYMDHDINSIKDCIDPDIMADYHTVDLALHSDNIWQTKMLRTKLDKQSYFLSPVDETCSETQAYLQKVKQEMHGLLYMWPE